MSEKKIKLLIMMEMSWQMWKEEKDSLSSEDLLAFISVIFSAKGQCINNNDLKRVLMDSSCFKIDKEGNIFFIEKSFMEFFLAKRLYHNFRKMKLKAIHRLLNTRLYTREIIYFLSVMDLQTNIINIPLITILQGNYFEKISENALNIYSESSKIKKSLKDSHTEKKDESQKNSNITNLITQHFDFSLKFKDNTINTTNKTINVSQIDNKAQAEEFFQKGVKLLKENKFFESLEPLFAAKALDPECFKAANNLAVVFKNLGSLSIAKKIAQNVLLENPENNRAKEHLKYLEYEEKKFNTKQLEDLR